MNWIRLWSPFYDRSDLAIDYYDKHIFDGATFNDLLAANGPALTINATDLGAANHFTFFQPQFDLICSDLSNFKVARAVAASSAVPGLFSPIVLRNYANDCGYVRPRWLDEALGHLEVIQPTVNHRFSILNVGTIERPQFERGFVSYRRRSLGGQDLIEHVEMFYRLVGAQPLVARVHPGSAGVIEERLRGSTLPYQYQTEQDDRRVVRYGLFHVQPHITASVRFEADYSRHIVQVTLRNVDRFESVSLEFGPDKLTEAALEDLVKLITGEPNSFLRRAPLALIRGSLGREAPAEPEVR